MIGVILIWLAQSGADREIVHRLFTRQPTARQPKQCPTIEDGSTVFG